MFREILEGRAILYAMAVFCAVGILSKLAVWISYRRLTKATENMAESKNTLTRQLKLKFENCYKLNLNVQNVPVFVDKYLQKYKVCGIRVHTANQILQASLLVNLLLGVISCAAVFLTELELRLIVLYAASTVCAVLVLYLVDYLLDINDKREMVVTNLQDYLENTLTNRLQHEYGEEEKREVLPEKETAKLLDQGKAQTAATRLKVKKQRQPKKDSIDEEEVIREILREFLT